MVFGFEGMMNTFKETVENTVRKKRSFFYSSPIGDTIFLDSSMVEHSAVNRVVVGSSPTRGADDLKFIWRLSEPAPRRTTVMSERISKV